MIEHSPMGDDGDGPYDAIVYDLDGTLVRLDVPWAECEAELGALLSDNAVDPDALTAWELLEAAEANGLGTEAASLIADYEQAGAETATRLPLADELLARDLPTGVCSLNCEAACRTALDRHDLLDAVDVIIGRDSHPDRKPAPGPLLAAVDALGVSPGRTLFIGDSESDRRTAEQAGTAFRPVPDGRTSR